MKKWFVVLAIVALLVTGTALAQEDLNGSGWWSAIQVQRTGTLAGEATVQMTAFSTQGAAVPSPAGGWDCGSRTLATFGSGATFFPHWDTDPSGANCANNPGFPASYEGGGMLESDDALVAVVQSQNISFGGWAPGDTPYGRAVGAYAGVGAPSIEIRFPVYKSDHNGETTTFYIQNAGGDAANIEAVFKPCSDDGTGNPCLGYPSEYTYPFTGLEPGKMLVLEASMAGAPSGRGSFGGLTVRSTNSQDLAGVVMEHHTTASPATYVKATRGLGANDYDDVLYAPAIKYQYPGGSSSSTPNASKWSSLVVLNADTVQVSIDLVATLAARNGDPAHPDVGTQYTYPSAPFALDPGESRFFLFHDGLNPMPGTQQRDLLSIKVEVVSPAEGKIVAIVNEEGDYSIAGTKDYATYSAMPASAGANSVSLPSYKEQYNGKFHGAIVMNIGDVPADFEATLTLVGTSGGYTGPMSPGDTVNMEYYKQVPPGGSAVFFMTCRDYFNEYNDLSGDTHNMADLCSGTHASGQGPDKGSNTAMIVNSTQPIVVLANEELLWYVSPTSAGDGYGEDASSYEGFPLP